MQYGLTWEQEAINNLIEKAICEADKKGAKVVSLGLLNLVYHLINIKSMQVKAKYLLRTGCCGRACGPMVKAHGRAQAGRGSSPRPRTGLQRRL
jgi:hypothetical protein